MPDPAFPGRAFRPAPEPHRTADADPHRTADAEPVAGRWALDPSVVFLNHGSFGACPREVLAAQSALRERLEAQPVHFLARELEPLLDAARARVARFVGADPDDLAFVPNATAGVNTVLRSLDFAPGDELLTTDHEYNASVNALRAAADGAAAHVVVAPIPFPLRSPGDAVQAILDRVTPRTRLALLDHVTSPTGLVLPLETLVPELRRRGVETLVDGAHAPGMLPLDLDALDAAYYTGNLHKWCCAPKGSAFLRVRRDLQGRIRPLSISHGANAPRVDRSRFRLEFDWSGTLDPTPYLCAPVAIDALGSMLAGGWPAVMAANHRLALYARDVVCAALGVPAPAPDGMLGAMAAILLPGPPASSRALSPLDDDPLQVALRERHGIEVPVLPWPQAWAPGGSAEARRIVRVSAQLYNDPTQYDRLATGLADLLGR